MIGKITAPRGEHVEPLIYHLYGPGRHEEHSDPHGDDHIHIVAMLARQDGRRPRLSNDR